MIYSSKVKQRMIDRLKQKVAMLEAELIMKRKEIRELKAELTTEKNKQLRVLKYTNKNIKGE